MLNNRLAQMLLGAMLTIALVGLLPGAMLWLDLNAFEKQQLKHILMPRSTLMLVLAAVGLAVPVLFFGRFYYRHLHSLDRVNLRLRDALKADGQALTLDSDLSPEEHTLLKNTNALMATVQERRNTLDNELEQNSRTQAREKTRLTALLGLIPQGVLVCNLEGRILLANGRARQMLGEQQQSSALGESIFALLDAELIAHALTIVRERLDNGTRAPRTTLSAMTRNGSLVRLQLAAAVADGEQNSVEGFVLTIEDIESQHTLSQERDKLLHGLTRETRNLLTRLRTGIDSMQRDPSAAPHQRTLLSALGRDTVRHCDHLERLSFQRADQLSHVWPLEPILAADLCSAVQQQLLRSHHLELSFAQANSDNLWLEADSFSLAQGIANCIAALRTDWDIDDISLSTDINYQHQLLLIHVNWLTGELRQEDFRAIATSTRQRMAVAGRALVELIERHGGRAWLEQQTQDKGQQLCFALPLSKAPSGTDMELPTSELAFQEAADSTTKALQDTQLRQQYITVLAVGAERNSAADLARGQSTLLALLLAGGKPQALAQKQLQKSTLAAQDTQQETLELGSFSRQGLFITHDATQLLIQLSTADRQQITQAGLLDTIELARLLFPTQNNHSLFNIASKLGLEAQADNTTEQVKLIARVFNRMLSRLQHQGIHSYAQLQNALKETTESSQS